MLFFFFSKLWLLITIWVILLNLYGQDVSTDGKWCYIVFWVIGDSQTRWGLLKKRLMGACPSCSSASVVLYYRAEMQAPKPSDVFLLKLSCYDRKGLLYGTFFFFTFNFLFLILYLCSCNFWFIFFILNIVILRWIWVLVC